MQALIEEIVAMQTSDCRIECPECGQDRRKQHQKTLSVTVHPHEILYMCHHCNAAGKVTPPNLNIPLARPKPKQKKVAEIPTQLNSDQKIILDFFRGRGIELGDVLPKDMPLMTTGMKYFPSAGEVPAIGFVYGHKERPEAIKWRPLEGKAFTQDGGAREFYGLHLLGEAPKQIIIVEGEPDVVALASIGIKAVSVPNGAPMKVSKGHIDPEEDKKFAYLWEAKELFDNAERVILACDADVAGEALTEEIARRVGRARCWRIQMPEGCKDVTDVIRDLGTEVAKNLFEEKQLVPMPLVGVYGATDYTASLFETYREGNGKGESTGIPALDEFISIAPGQFSVITGLPSSGKSEFVDQLMINLAVNKSWKFAVASFENPPHIHIAKLAEKIVGKPFHEGPTPRMNKADLEGAVEFINNHFVFLESKDGSMSTIDSIIDRCKQAVLRLGVRGLLVDPFNYLEMDRAEGEHQAINQMLTKITSFAKAYGIHIFFVAHPAKIYPREDGTMPIPKGMHVSGSSAWFAKCDLGVTVHRAGGAIVEIHTWKCRFKWIGQQGVCRLQYDVPTGRYSEAPEQVHEWGAPRDGFKRSGFSGSKQMSKQELDQLEF